MKIPASVRELIAKAPLAHLTTLNSTGGPQVTVAWVGIEDEEFVTGHLALHQKVKNIRRDPRVALSLLSDKTSAQGMREYLVVYGNARVTEGGAVQLLQRLAPLISDRMPTFRRLPCVAFPATSPELRQHALPESGRGPSQLLTKPPGLKKFSCRMTRGMWHLS